MSAAPGVNAEPPFRFTSTDLSDSEFGATREALVAVPPEFTQSPVTPYQEYREMVGVWHMVTGYVHVLP